MWDIAPFDARNPFRQNQLVWMTDDSIRVTGPQIYAYRSIEIFGGP
jgi:hypothetical protein